MTFSRTPLPTAEASGNPERLSGIREAANESPFTVCDPNRGAGEASAKHRSGAIAGSDRPCQACRAPDAMRSGALCGADRSALHRERRE